MQAPFPTVWGFLCCISSATIIPIPPGFCLQIFCSSSGGGAKVAAEFGAPFLGRVPMDPALTEAAEKGQPASAAAKAAGSARAIGAVARALLEQIGEK